MKPHRDLSEAEHGTKIHSPLPVAQSKSLEELLELPPNRDDPSTPGPVKTSTKLNLELEN